MFRLIILGVAAVMTTDPAHVARSQAVDPDRWPFMELVAENSLGHRLEIATEAGVTTLNYQGDVHSHPNGNPLPSQADWVGFMATNNDARKAGRTNETFFMYVIAIDQNGGPPKIYVYQDGPRAANSAVPPRPTEVGPEVNPDAQPCS